jgi:hypothetical protein
MHVTLMALSKHRVPLELEDRFKALGMK